MTDMEDGLKTLGLLTVGGIAGAIITYLATSVARPAGAALSYQGVTLGPSSYGEIGGSPTTASIRVSS